MKFKNIFLIACIVFSAWANAQVFDFSISPKVQGGTPIYLNAINDQFVQFYVLPSKKQVAYSTSRIGAVVKEIKLNADAVAMAIDERAVYIMDEKEKLISVFEISTGRLVSKIGSNAPEKIKKTSGMAILSNGELVVLESHKNVFYYFDKSGSFLRAVNLAGLVSPTKMLVDKKNIFVFDDKLDALVKFSLDGKPDGTQRLYADASIKDDKKGKIGDVVMDAMNILWIWNKSQNQIQAYQWTGSPTMIYSAGTKEGIQLDKAESITINHVAYELQIHLKDFTRYYQIKLPVATPPNLFGFDVQAEKLIVNFKSDASPTASHFGLLTQNKDGFDSLAYISSGKAIIIDSETHYQEKAKRYKLIAFNGSHTSEPSAGFDNFYGYGHYLRKLNKPGESFAAYQNALRYMGRPAKMVQFASVAMVDLGKSLIAQNVELIKGLNVLKTAYNINPREPIIQRGLTQGFSNLFWRLAAQENYQAIVEESNKVIHQTLLKPSIIQSVDSIAQTLEKLNTASSLTNARLLRIAMVDWAPEQTSVWKAVYNLDLALFQLRQKNGSADYELKALSSEAERHIFRAVELLQKSGRPFIPEYQMYLNALLLGNKYEELEKKSIWILENHSGKMDASQTLSIKEYQANALIGLKKYNEALDAFNYLLTQRPNENKWKENLADLLYNLKNPSEALVLYKQLLLSQKENVAYLSKIGLTELALGNATEATIQLEKAIKLDPTHIQLAGSLGEAYEAINSIPRAIDQYKIAINLYTHTRSGSASFIKEQQDLLKKYQSKLGKLYHNTNQFDLASDLFRTLTRTDADNAAHWYALGQAELSRGLVYESVKAFQKASSLESTNQEYKAALSTATDLRSQISKNEDPLSITEAKLVEIFPSLYLTYGETSLTPIGNISLTNNTALPIRYSQIVVDIPQVMSEPTILAGGVITSFSNATIYLSAILSQQILNFSQSQKLQARISVQYNYNEKNNTSTKTIPVIINHRNAINWSDKRKIASFIAVGTGPMAEYANTSNKLFADLPEIQVPSNLSKAIQLYTMLKQEKLVYTPDPDLNYSSVSSNTNLIDFIQYPGETLKKKGGDCDDLVALYVSVLENAGVSTAFVDVPGHIFMAVDLNIPVSQIESMGFTSSNVIINSNKVWLPIETTLLGTNSFIDAWESAAKRYHLELNKGNTPDIIPMVDAKKIYRPSLYHPSDLVTKNFEKPVLVKEYQEQLTRVFAKINEGSLVALKNQYLYEPFNVFIKNKYAVILAQSGRISEAKNILQEALVVSPGNASVLNNLGNVSLLEGDLQKSIEFYEKSYSFDNSDYQTTINLVKVYLKLNDKNNARKWLDIASNIDSRYTEYFNKLINQIK